MKKFKDLVASLSTSRLSKKIPVLSWPGHETLRDKIKKIPILSWPGHETLRGKKPIKEGYYQPEYDKEYHDHPDIRGTGLTPDHLDAIKHYTSTGGRNTENGHRASYVMNGHLRRREGATDSQSNVEGHEPSKIENGIKQFSSVFTPENTNKTKTVLYGGIPAHIGKALKSAGRGSQHHLPGFTSTTSEPATAFQFARQYNRKTPTGKSHHHMIEYHAEPGTALSVAPFSSYDENESILHHGAKITYHGEKVHKDDYGNTIHTHVVTVHNEHKPLEDYGK